MGKRADTAFLDPILDKIATCTLLSICSAEPANKAAVAGLTLASVVIAGVDFTKAAGDVSGRKVTVAQQAAMSIVASGSATHVVMDDATDLYITTCTSQLLTFGGTVTNPAFDVEIAASV